jgi:hypothetical protein
MPPDWNELRARLSHDLVKNRLIPGTTRMTRIVSGSVIADPIETFDLIIITVWAETKTPLQVLFDTCESDLSPRNYFSVEPLVHCPPSTMEWLPDLIHELWLERHDIRGWSEAGKTLAEDLDLAIQNAGELLQYHNVDDRKGDLLEAFVLLQNRTASLSAHLSAIDSKSLI